MVPIPAHTLSDGPQSCLLIFSILLELRHGELIDIFVRLDLTDHALPLDEARLARLECSADLKRAFYAAQWAYCPVLFSLDMARDLDDHAILPIHQKRLVSKGATADVLIIVVLEDFIAENLRQRCRRASFHAADVGTVSEQNSYELPDSRY
jgi:hypothetical protein